MGTRKFNSFFVLSWHAWIRCLLQDLPPHPWPARLNPTYTHGSGSFKIISDLSLAKMSETLPCHYTSAALMCVMGFFQSTIYALCVERDWTQWKLGWDIRLWTAAYSGIMGTALIVTLMAICSSLRGPLFVAIFNPLMLVIVAVPCVLFLDEKLYLGSVLGAILIVSGVYIVLWGKNKEISGLLPSGKIHTQKSLEIIVASSSDEGSPAQMKMIDNDINERKEIVMPLK